MADRRTAEAARDDLYDHGAEILGVAPVAVGLVPHGAGAYSVKVTLPKAAKPLDQPPNLNGVLLEYDFAPGPAVMTTSAEAPWMKAARAGVKRRSGPR